MAKLVVLGLDAADYNWIGRHQHVMPHLVGLMKEHNGALLESDVRGEGPQSIHSAPAWTTIFTGKTPQEHGIHDFAQTKIPTGSGPYHEIFRPDLPWLWNKAKRPIVKAVPVHVMGINIRCDWLNWGKIFAPVTQKEILYSVDHFAEHTDHVLRSDDWDLFITVWGTLDRAGHLGMGTKGYAANAKYLDESLNKLWPLVEEHDWCILSDHGMIGAEESTVRGWGHPHPDGRKGDHSPNGIWCSSFAKVEKLSEVYDVLVRQFESQD